jgi:TolA-binding protein
VTFAKPQPAISDEGRSIEVNALRGVITQLSAEVASLKASLDTNAKTASSQLNKIAERVERSERAQAEPAARVAKLSELLERIDKRTAAASAPTIPASAPALASAAPETTGSIAPKQQERPAIVSDWILREVYRGRALVENARFGMYEVAPGNSLPGIGRIENIRRQDGRWVVVTPRGLIVDR